MLKNLLAPHNFLNWLLVFVPVAVALELSHASAMAIFITAGLAIVPLAAWMGRATEHVAEKLGEGIGGLLNATFGNAAELIIALLALRAGLFDVVKASLTGSIIGNVLLVLGLSVLSGGIKFPKQRFNAAAAMIGSTMLALAAIGLLMPAVFHYLVRNHPEVREQDLSLEIAIVLFVTYVFSLIFTLRTHAHLYVGELHKEEEEAIGTHGWSMKRSIITLFVATALVALMSEFLVGAVELASKQMGLTEVFVGVIVVAIIGNAAEHSTAVMMAMKNKMDLALNIAIGSSLQIALFVAPVLLFASYALAPHPMDLVFTSLEVIAIAVSVAVVALIAQDGESNWMEGLLLLAVYVILGLTFYSLP